MPSLENWDGGLHVHVACFHMYDAVIMKGTKVQTLGGRAVAGAWLVAWAIMAMGAIIKRMRTAN